MKKQKIKKQSRVTEKKEASREREEFKNIECINYLFLDEGFQRLYTGNSFFRQRKYFNNKVKS